MACLLSLEGISRTVRRGDGRVEPLFTDVSLNVLGGELVAVVGTRSAGKTTLLELASGLERPDAGVVRFDGRDLAGLSEADHARLLREDVGLVGQTGPPGDLRVGEYVAGPLLVSRRRQLRRSVALSVLAALDRVGMASSARQRWGRLSRWDRALVELAQGIVAGSRLLLVDDITDGLGMRETAHIGRLLRSLTQREGLAVLMAVSDGEAAACAHRVLRLSRGSLREISAQPPQLRENVVALRSALGHGGSVGQGYADSA
jgi:putative ABC transport system ATP-binding protein